ncbi:MAG: HAD hydrolase-like protein [Bacteroidetes bacterium]|nr:HAD hydrolase-like protein [Bacteroidota bacterium]MBS1683433.1 HAD hydrolase-like protein [Bacteroidota bacterium]
MGQDKIRTIFLDVGGVLLTNGWDTAARSRAIQSFHLDENDTEKRHAMAFDIYERGRITLDEYLDYLVFFEVRSFSKQQFKEFMFGQSQALAGALEFFHDLKARNNIPIVALNNEPRELNTYRIEKFALDSLFDSFISSCYIDMRKPEEKMYRMACDIAGTEPACALYIDDRAYYMPTAGRVGLRCLHHTSLDATRGELIKYGFKI